MHELSIATSLIEVATQAAASAGGGRIDTLHVRIGALSGVVPQALEFAWDVARPNTACQHATLEIERVEARARCTACNLDFPLPELVPLRCPACARPAEWIAGRELSLDSLRLSDEHPSEMTT